MAYDRSRDRLPAGSARSPRGTRGVHAHDIAAGSRLLEVEQFEFAFEPRFRPMLAMIGVTPGTAHVTLTLIARGAVWAVDL